MTRAGSKQEPHRSMEVQELRAQLAELTIRLTALEGDAGDQPRPRRVNVVTRPHSYPLEQTPCEEVPMAATRVVTTHMVTPAQSNGMGVCMGGEVLSWIDVAAGLAAKTLARGPCVTASVDAVHFLKPCRVGAVVLVAAMVNRTFKTSMEVGVRVEEECTRTGMRHHCCSAYLTFVAVDGAKNTSRRIPRVHPGGSRRCEIIFEEALVRREARLEGRARLRRDPAAAAAEATCRLLPLTHRTAEPTLPPSLNAQLGYHPASNNHDSTSPMGIQEKRVSKVRPQISPSYTTAHLTHIIMPHHANSIGITFGGQVLRWIEQAAFVVAARMSRGGHLLTATVDGVTFGQPTHIGDTFYVEAQATAVFGSSVEVMVSLWGEVPEQGKPFHCGDAFVTVVSVDAAGAPKDIPFELVPTSPQEAARYAGAVARRAGRLVLREKLLEEEKRERSSLEANSYSYSDVLPGNGPS